MGIGPNTDTRVSVAGGQRLDGLDGLRGLAMLMVIAVHLKVFWIGWTGLSSFFVLSGFLITRILMFDRDRASGLGDYFRRFYIRRTLRVFPIYYAYLLALTLCTLLFVELRPIQGQLPAAFFYLYNFEMIVPEGNTQALGHLWSLSVEEQFYLLWPWVVVFLSRRALRNLCLALIIAGPLLRWLAADWLFPALDLGGARRVICTYLLTSSHLDAFAFGALLNFGLPVVRDRHVLGALLAALALGLLVNLGASNLPMSTLGWPLFLPNGYQYVWGYTLVNAFWWLVIAAILGHQGWVRRLFTLPLLDYLGKRSYSTYVLHFPLLAVAHPLLELATASLGRLPGTAAFSIPYLLVVFLLSDLSYRYIEMPMNALKERFSSSAAPPVADQEPDHASARRPDKAREPG